MEEGRGEEGVPDPLVVALHRRRRVNPRAASDGGAWEDAPPMLLLSFAFTELSLHCYRFFRVYFVIFLIV